MQIFDLRPCFILINIFSAYESGISHICNEKGMIRRGKITLSMYNYALRIKQHGFKTWLDTLNYVCKREKITPEGLSDAIEKIAKIVVLNRNSRFVPIQSKSVINFSLR